MRGPSNPGSRTACLHRCRSGTETPVSVHRSWRSPADERWPYPRNKSQVVCLASFGATILGPFLFFLSEFLPGYGSARLRYMTAQELLHSVSKAGLAAFLAA